MSRRRMLALLGALGGSGLMYQAMTNFGHAAPSPYTGRIQLDGDANGTRVLVLGAGCAGLTAAFELRNAGYHVQLLEFNDRPGGRSWTIRGGDRITDMSGETQVCGFSAGNYINPGPWRIAHHHRAMLDYCRRLKVPVEPFIEVNYNAYLHSTHAFGGKPVRQHEVLPDFQGHVADLLAKASRQAQLDDSLTARDFDLLRETLQGWGGLNRDLRYVRGPESAKLRGDSAMDWAAGTHASGEPLALPELLSLLRDSELFHTSNHSGYRDLQTPLFQPVGGMDMLPRAFARELGDVVRYNARVVAIQQDDRGVTVDYEDAKTPGNRRQVSADYCLCTIPLSVLSRLDIQVGPQMKAAIGAVPYSTYMKIGLEFERRFWEQDEAIYGGFTHTNLPISTLSYPSYNTNSDGPGVLYGAVVSGSYSYEYAGMPAAERIEKALEYGAQIHPQMRREFRNGVAVCWHRVPFSMGGFAMWSEAAHREHYEALRAIDGRVLLAGEHLATAVGGWQEGAVLSALDAIERLHHKVIGA